MRTIRILFFLLTVLAVAGCTGLQPMSGDMDQAMSTEMAAEDAMPAPEPGQLSVVNPMARPSPMMAGNGAAYMTILNGLASDVQLVSAESAVSEVVELHETVDDNGVMRMIPHPEGFTVPAGEGIQLQPGGKHVMLINLVDPLEPGDQVEITLNFDNGESATVTVPVMEMSGEMPMNMDGEGN